MAIGIDDLYDDDLIEDQLENQNGEQFFNQEPPTNVSSGEQIEDDVLQSFLRTKGIDDPSRIKFEDENGNLQERSWDSLDPQEKLNILNTPVQQDTVQEPINNVDNQLQDDEIDLINSIRNSGLSPQNYIQSIVDNQNNSEPIYQVDDLSDDEIYILDLESRVGELSEDEAAQALTMAKQNEEFYKKQIEGIRKEYKEREDFKKEQESFLQKISTDKYLFNYVKEILTGSEMEETGTHYLRQRNSKLLNGPFIYSINLITSL